MTTSIVPSPWAQQERESFQAFAAFKVYRDMRPEDRSAAKVARIIGKGVKLCDKWCVNHSWVIRAKAWDAYVDNREIENRLATVDTVASLITQNLASQVSTVNKAVQARMGELEARINAGDLPTIKELRETIALLKETDQLMQRISGGSAYGIRDETYEL